MHGDFYRQGTGISRGMEDGRVQNRLVAIDVFNEAFDTTGESEIFFLAGTLIDQANTYPVVEEGKFAQTLGQNFVMEFNVTEDFLISKEVNFGAALFSITNYPQRRNFHAILDLDQAIDCDAAIEFQQMFFAITTNCQA